MMGVFFPYSDVHPEIVAKIPPKPSIPGIRRSNTITSGWLEFAICNASSGLLSQITFDPYSFIYSLHSDSMFISSSTNKMVLF